jgi:hypothetical protein
MKNEDPRSLAAFALALAVLGLVALALNHIGIAVGALGVAGYFAWRWWRIRQG